jgi:glycosyltransferase involved in cell wall biosynthesis
MKSQPLQLSIVVPVYNAAPYLEDCVRSLLDQDLQASEYEILLINDGSTDDSLRIAEQLCTRSPNVKVISRENRGIGATRNLGLDRSAGEFLWFVDSDDVIARNCLGTLLRGLRGYQLDLITYHIRMVRERVVDRPALRGFVFLPGKALMEVSSGVQYIADHNYSNGPWSYIIRSKYLRETNLRFIEDRWCEDAMFSISLLSAASRVGHLPVAAYAYVKNPNSNMSTKTVSHRRKMVKDFQYTVDYFDQFIMEISQRTNIPPRFLKRVACRRDSFVFFLLIRLFRARLGWDYTQAVYRQLVAKGRIPPRDLCGEDYPGLKYRVLSTVVSAPWLYLGVCWIVNVLRPVKYINGEKD